MNDRFIGDVSVGEIGLGGMPMSIEGRPDEARSIATIHAALDVGVNLIDTADAYHRDADEVGHNELLIAKALATYGGDTSDVLVATKGGHLRPGDGSWTVNGRPEYLKQAAQASARRLGVEAIGLYQFHRPDPQVDYADSVGALRDLLDDGVIRMAGISNANVDQIRLAQEILGGRLVSVQNQFSPAFRSSQVGVGAVRGTGHRLPAVEPARRHLTGQHPRRKGRRVRADRRRARSELAAGVSRMGALARPRRHPHPRRITARQHPGLRTSPLPHPHRRPDHGALLMTATQNSDTNRTPYRTLGRSGTVVFEQALGTMTFGAEADEATSHAIIDAYVAGGGNFIDTADVYSAGRSEEIIGRWLAAHPAEAAQIVIATKGRFPMGAGPNDHGTSRRHLRTALDDSLRRLGVEHIDLYQMHAWDAITPLDETLRFLDDAISQGKIGYYGFSNFTGWQLTKATSLAERHGWNLPVTLQPQYSLLVRGIEHEIVPAALDAGLGLLPWSPLGGGWLSGKYRRDVPPTGTTRLGENPERGMEAWKQRNAEPPHLADHRHAHRHRGSARRLAVAGRARLARSAARGDIRDPRRPIGRAAPRQHGRGHARTRCGGTREPDRGQCPADGRLPLR